MDLMMQDISGALGSESAGESTKYGISSVCLSHGSIQGCGSGNTELIYTGIKREEPIKTEYVTWRS